MFAEEFDGVPREVETVLKKQLEAVVRLIATRYNASARDFLGPKPFTPDQLSAMVSTVFDTAASFKPFNTEPENLS